MSYSLKNLALNYYIELDENNQTYIKKYVRNLPEKSELYNFFSKLKTIKNNLEKDVKTKVSKKSELIRYNRNFIEENTKVYTQKIGKEKKSLSNLEKYPKNIALNYYLELDENNQTYIKKYIRNLPKESELYQFFLRLRSIKNNPVEVKRQNALLNALYDYPENNQIVFIEKLDIHLFHPVIEILPDGNCTYRAIGTLVTGERNSKTSKQHILIRVISAKYISDAYIIKNTFIGIIYHIFSGRDNIVNSKYNKMNSTQEKRTRSMRSEIMDRGELVYIIYSKEIFNKLGENTKEIFRNIISNKENYFSIVYEVDQLWELIPENEKEKIRKLIKEIIKINNSTYKSYLDFTYEMPTLLEGLYKDGYGNIIIVEFTYAENDNNYFSSCIIYTKINRIKIDNNTLFGFITSEDGHTNLLYPKLYTISTIPVEMKETFNLIFRKKY